MEHKKIIQKVARKFAKNESDNFHSENAVLLAVNFGNEEDVANAVRIEREHKRLGYMTEELLFDRDKIYKKCYPILVRWMNTYGIKKR
jgi:hypothetical protein